MDDWVLDSLVGFLKSSTWSCPINSFTDKNCAVFDSGEENKFSYTDIHKEYQTLVENLLEGFTNELGITGDQFTQACSQLQTSKTGQDNEELFDQVLATDDFLLFKSAMVRRNIDLELQALAVIEKQMGHSPLVYDKESSDSEENTVGSRKELEEEEMFAEAVRMSEAQYRLESSLDDEQLHRLIEETKAESLRLYKQEQGTASGGEGRAERGGVIGLGEGGGDDIRLDTREGGDGEPSPCTGLQKTVEQAEGFGLGTAEGEEGEISTCAEQKLEGKPESCFRKEGDTAERQLGKGYLEGGIQQTAPLTESLQVTTVDSLAPHRDSRQDLPATYTTKQSITTELPPLDCQAQLLPNPPQTSAEMDRSVSLPTTGAEWGNDDAMAKWLAVARASSGHTNTESSHHTQPTAGPTPEQLKARELYLKRQRDHLLETTKKQRLRHSRATCASSKRPASRRVVSPTTSDRSGSGGGRVAGRETDRGKQNRDTGVLSSAIAGNLKSS